MRVSSASAPRGQIWTILLFACVMVLVVGGIVFGAKICGLAFDGSSANSHQRALSGYLTSVLEASDSSGVVEIDHGDMGDMLVIKSDDGEYAQRIYEYDGSLMEEYSLVSSQPDPQGASAIASTSTFSASMSGNTITLETDSGSVVYTLRSSQSSSSSAEGSA